MGRTAPNFDLRSLEGQRISLASLRGHPVVLNFWASWCLACRVEHPDLTAAWQRWGNRGVVFLGIIYQDTPQAAREFLSGLGGAWPSLIDPGGRFALDYGVYGVPETYFISGGGKIVFKRTGPSTYSLLRRWIERLLPSTHDGSVGERP
ncbi:MAG: TlpA family protein disulfide reductase [Actinomycetota bacterium]